MFFATSNNNLALIISLCVLGGSLLFSLLIILIVKLKNKKHSRIKVDEDFINELVTALGQRKNIVSVSTVNGRIHFTVEELELVQLEALKKLSTAGVFITNTTIKMLFTMDSETICKAVMDLPRTE